MDKIDRKDVIELLKLSFSRDCYDWGGLYITAMKKLGIDTDTGAKEQWTEEDALDCALEAIKKETTNGQ